MSSLSLRSPRLCVRVTLILSCCFEGVSRSFIAICFDGRNLYEPEMLRALGLSYYAIGRGDHVADRSPAFGRRKTDKVRAEAS